MKRLGLLLLLILSGCKTIVTSDDGGKIWHSPPGREPQVTTVERSVSWKMVEN